MDVPNAIQQNSFILCSNIDLLDYFPYFINEKSLSN